MTLPPYSTYKDSGVEWLGEVPAHWTTLRLGALFREVADEGVEGLPILSVSIHNGVSDRELGDEELDRKVTRSDDVTKYIRVAPGDLVYNMMRAWQGGFGTVTVSGMVSPAYVVARPTTTIATSFVEQLLRTPMAVEEMRRLSKGVTDFRLRLYWDEFKTLKIAIPPETEQFLIASFLQRETAKIDALIGEQERLIELLAEKRRAVISHAITRGLDPTAPMKDSGISWLGEVPAHWDVAPVGSRFDVQLGKMLDTARQTGDNLRPYLRVADVQWGQINTEELPEMDFDEQSRARFRLLPGDLLVNEGGSYVGRSAVWNGELQECYYQKALHRLRPHNVRRDDPKFMFFIMNFATELGVFVAGGNQTTIDHLTAQSLRRYRFAFPPPAEQHHIAAHLDRASAKLDALKSEAEGAVALLKERRAALISAAVTGKIDVRDAIEAAA